MCYSFKKKQEEIIVLTVSIVIYIKSVSTIKLLIPIFINLSSFLFSIIASICMTKQDPLTIAHKIKVKFKVFIILNKNGMKRTNC